MFRPMATPPPSDQPDREVLAGVVERVTFHNEENGFCVLRAKARGHRDLLRLTEAGPQRARTGVPAREPAFASSTILHETGRCGIENRVRKPDCRRRLCSACG